MTIMLNELKDRIVGRANTEITPELAATLGGAIGTYYGENSVFIASRDFRRDSRMLKRGISAGVMSTGCTMIDLHASPAVANQFAVRRFGAVAGISVASSHRAKDDVRIRLFDYSGVDISEKTTNKILDMMKKNDINRVPICDIGWINPLEPGTYVYEKALLGFVDTKVIKKRTPKFRIVVDCSLGPTSLIIPNMLSELDAEVISLNSYVPGSVMEILPNPDSIEKMRKAVQATESDLGITLDTEGRQILVIDNQGKIYSGDELASIFLMHIAKKRDGGTLVLSNTLTSRMDHYLKEKGFELVRERDASGALGRKIQKTRATFGASDRGIFHFPAFGASDGILACFVLLEIMSKDEKQLSELCRLLPTDVATTKEISLPEKVNQEAIMHHLQYETAEVRAIDTLVGVKLAYPEGWVHVKPGLQPYTFQLTQETTTSSVDLFDITEDKIWKAIELLKT